MKKELTILWAIFILSVFCMYLVKLGEGDKLLLMFVSFSLLSLIGCIYNYQIRNKNEKIRN
jgi:4-hydroxybenzoate polyprenyltransferase